MEGFEQARTVMEQQMFFDNGPSVWSGSYVEEKLKGLGTGGRETREELLLWSIEQMTVGPVSWAWCRVASLVLIWGNKLSPNIMA